MKNISGYIGSGLVHLAVAGLLVAGALFARNLTPEKGFVETGRGSESPGITVLPDSGSESGSPSAPTTPGMRNVDRLPTVTSVSSKPIIEEIRRREREQDAEAAATAVPVSRPVAKSVVTPKPVSVSKKPVASRVGGPAPVNRVGIVGVSLAAMGDAGAARPGPGSVSAGGAPGRMSSTDAGDSAFAAEVTAKFAVEYGPLFEVRGGALSSDADSGRLRVSVSPSGTVSFHDWIVAPAESGMDAIVRAAVKGMKRVGKPPSGAETLVVITVSGTVTE